MASQGIVVTGGAGPINPDEMTMLELAAKVIDFVGGSSDIGYRPLAAADPVQRRPDIARAAAVPGWRPATGLDEGLAGTVEYFRSTTVLA
jgi:nucleoside-diphosphate-sugar epimerase